MRSPLSANAGASLHLGSSLRTRSAAATWAAAAPLMPALGITRVTDITRMDRLGLPVFSSVRPRGRALGVHAGKGLGPAEARVGALMEALEFSAAEPQRSHWDSRNLRIGDLVDSWAGALTLADLVPRFGIVAPPDRLLQAVLCEQVAGGAPLWLPAELVFVPHADPHGLALFGWSSNGLASGNTLAEATLHGLLEVLERDALGMNMAADASCWLDADDYPAPFDALARDWQARGIDLAVRQVPNDFGLPCFQAVLAEDSRDQTVDLSEGSGLHLDAGIAFTRAVCEAAQSRLSCIHGGREDVAVFYDTLAAQGPARDMRQTPAWCAAFDRSRLVRWAEVPSLPVHGIAIDTLLTGLLQRLAGRGFGPVLRHHFDLPLAGLQVVKVIVPNCQEAEAPLERVSRRLLDRARQHG